MPIETTQPITLRFLNCDAGWIRFSVVAGDQSVSIRASHIYDPFPDFICWMHAILTGVQEASFRIDEEGIEAEFIARRCPQGNVLLLIQERLDEFLLTLGHAAETRELLRVTLSLRQLIEGIYLAICEFARSPEYRKDQWERESLADRFRSLVPTVDDGQIIQHLASLTRDELVRVLFKAAPSYWVHFPDAPDKKTEFSRAIDYFLDPENAVTSAGMYQEPDEWDIPKEYDDWSLAQKTECVLQLLREPVNSWDGCKLGEFESPAIERYLAHPEMDDGAWSQ